MSDYNYFIKYVKYKKKYLILKNLGGGHHCEDLENPFLCQGDKQCKLINDTICINKINIDDNLASFVNFQLEYAKKNLKIKTSVGGTFEGSLYHDIPSGGSFTNKYEYKISGSKYKLFYMQDKSTKRRLLRNTELFNDLINDISGNNTLTLLSRNILIYRAINLPFTNGEIVADNSLLNHYIPFSCSWSKELAVTGWTGYSHLLEIEMPYNYPFITLSHPSFPLIDNTWLIKDTSGNLKTMSKIEKRDIPVAKMIQFMKEHIIKPINQGQLELCLVPSEFTIISTAKKNGMNIIRVKPTPIKLETSISFIEGLQQNVKPIS